MAYWKRRLPRSPVRLMHCSPPRAMEGARAAAQPAPSCRAFVTVAVGALDVEAGRSRSGEPGRRFSWLETPAAKEAGIRPEDIDRLLEHLILLLNLTQSVENTVEECGAVTRRKLAVAIAIIGLPPVVLMDDPATGLDLMSKRKIYRTISMLRQLVKSAVFIVTHSLSDCVVMSDRMAIMLEGQFQCVGTVAELRDRLCVGTVLLIKLSLSSAYDAEALKLVHMLVLKAFPSAVYNGRLGHSIEYTVTPSAPWSQLVPRVHELQVQVAAYASDVILTDMTLEHALLKIVKYQKPKVASTPAADAIAL
ncbi:ATP-binding cassette sub-family A member 6-like [Amblyomma americanum]